MKRSSMLAVILLMPCVLAGAMSVSDEYVKVRHAPGRILSGSFVEVSIEPFGADTALVARVHEKLKELQQTRSLNYVVPDAPTTTLEVSYKAEVLKSSFSPIGLPSNREEYDRFEKLWTEAYSIAWDVVEKKLAPEEREQ